MKDKSEVQNRLEEPEYSGIYTARDYVSWRTEELMELIRGKVFKMSPAPSSSHQRVDVKLASLFLAHFNKKCAVYVAPLDVFLIHPGEDWEDTKNIVQPDVLVICDKHKIKERGCIGAPDLVIEILSPNTTKKDSGIKRDLYEEYGVKEMWIVHPQDETIALHV